MSNESLRDDSKSWSLAVELDDDVDIKAEENGSMFIK